MNIILEIEKILSDLGYENAKVTVSNRPDLGDYQFNGAFNLARVYHKSPVMIADEIVEKLKDNKKFKNVTNANGFVNLTLSDEFLVNYMNEVNNNFDINTYKSHYTHLVSTFRLGFAFHSTLDLSTLHLCRQYMVHLFLNQIRLHKVVLLSLL